ncbi:MAG TPA: hypothetical protein PLW51_03450 [Bacillota bacterium]|jgi:hypothetical protein|nr:hypothetical protein [Bacillota bacterium]HOB29545.1 hypothetical protein [Bacillota bacterium]HPZ42094.1 hypothetical protein [Bacillota bacterium]HQD52232.1 hypothetical protein [Bacillota bacterium]
MKQWRAGSFSMGLILVLLGIGLILDHFSGAPAAIELIITWWPLALIMLGAEILAANFLSRNERYQVKYDGWSILLMIVLFFFCLGSYSLSSSGVMSQIHEALSFSEYSCAIPDQEINLTGIEKVILSSQESDLELRNTPGDKLTILGQATIRAASAEMAETLAELAQAEVNTVEDTLFIRINRVPEQKNIFGHDHNRTGNAIFIPAGTTLEVVSSGFESSTLISLDSYAAPWSVDSEGPVRVYLDRDLDLTLFGTTTWSRENLTGNADWEYTSPDDPDNDSSQKVTGKIKLGQGRWPLVISSEQSIEVNLHPVQ